MTFIPRFLLPPLFITFYCTHDTDVISAGMCIFWGGGGVAAASRFPPGRHTTANTLAGTYYQFNLTCNNMFLWLLLPHFLSALTTNFERGKLWSFISTRKNSTNFHFTEAECSFREAEHRFSTQSRFWDSNFFSTSCNNYLPTDIHFLPGQIRGFLEYLHLFA